jgi:transposase
MPNRVRVLTVPESDQAELLRRLQDRDVPARAAERARIVLLAAGGLTGPQIAALTGCTEPTVIKWRRQYAGAGLAGLEDARRPGGPRTVLTEDVVGEILAATVAQPPQALAAQGVRHWSSRRLADWLRRSREIMVSHDSISRLWRRYGLQPHRTGGFRFSTDPELDANVKDVVGVYLNPPDSAVAICVGEESQGQALERTRPVLPMRAGGTQRQARYCAQRGAACLFAALEAAAGQVTDASYPRPRHAEFLCFLTKAAAACPRTELHVILDSYATPQHPEVRRWLARPENLRISLHFTTASCPWLNLVECFFSIMTRRATRCGSFISVRQLTAAIGGFLDQWNEHPRPFAWTKDADEILGRIRPGILKQMVLQATTEFRYCRLRNPELSFASDAGCPAGNDFHDRHRPGE